MGHVNAGCFVAIGSNQAFTEAAHMAFKPVMVEFNYYKPDVAARFVEA